MERRAFLKASLAFAAYCGMPAMSSLFSRTAAAAEVADGDVTPFDFSTLQTMAQELAAAPYGGPPAALPPTLAGLTPQAYNKIQYDHDHSLWNGNGPDRQLDVELFHVGMGFKRRVRVFSVDAQKHQAREIHFRPALFNYNDAGVDTKQLEGHESLGFAGFKVNKAPELTRRDVVSFLGASYFRAVDDTYQYGLSARGLAIDTFSDHEEFPDFTAFWFDRPSPADTTFTVYALLDSPSATGAYRFTIHCEKDRVVMDIEKHLHARKTITQLGISPMTSMFSCGTNERRMCDTIHPQIHDSDRLAMWRGNGEWICRPLNNPQRLQFNAYDDENPRGFGLLQTDHDFENYQDIIGWYSKRPSLWVEPVGNWGKGAVNLMEIPTTGETLDNIVCFWQPAEPLQAGQQHSYRYRLHWCAQPPARSPLANVKATRTGMGGFPEGWAPGEHYPTVWARRFAVDYIGGDLKSFADKGIEPVINASAGRINNIEILYVEPMNGYRILFDWYPDSDKTDPVELRMFLRSGQETLSDTWLYQYFPPPADKRQYIDDRQMR